MHFPMRCLRSESQRAGRAAVTEALRGAAKVDERRHGAYVAWRKGVDSLKRKELICRRGILWKNVYGFALRKIITRSISAITLRARYHILLEQVASISNLPARLVEYSKC